MSVINKFYPIYIKGDDTITQLQTNYNNKVSFQNTGKSEFRNDIYLNNLASLLINKDKSSTNYYKLDVNAPSRFSIIPRVDDTNSDSLIPSTAGDLITYSFLLSSFGSLNPTGTQTWLGTNLFYTLACNTPATTINSDQCATTKYVKNNLLNYTTTTDLTALLLLYTTNTSLSSTLLNYITSSTLSTSILSNFKFIKHFFRS